MGSEEDSTSGRHSSKKDVIAVFRPTVASKRVSINGGKWTVLDDETESRVIHDGVISSHYEEAHTHFEVARRRLNPQSRSREIRVARMYSRPSRQGTVVPEDKLPCTVSLDLNQRTKTAGGFVCGRDDEMSDFVIPQHFVQVSNCHFSITFNENYELIVRDLRSKWRTNVLYDGYPVSGRTNGIWVIGGSDFLQNIEKITIRIPHNIEIEVEVEAFNPKCPEFRHKVDKFLHRSDKPQNAVDDSHLSRLPGPTGSNTPVLPQITMRRPLDGSFNPVHLITDLIVGKRWIEISDSVHGDLASQAKILRQICHVRLGACSYNTTASKVDSSLLEKHRQIYRLENRTNTYFSARVYPWRYTSLAYTEAPLLYLGRVCGDCTTDYICRGFYTRN